MSKSLGGLMTAIRGVQKLADRLSQAQTIEQVYAFGLNVLQDLFEPNGAFVVLPESVSKRPPSNHTAGSQQDSLTDLSIPIVAGGESLGEFMIRFDIPRAFSQLDHVLAGLVAAQTGSALRHVREQQRLEQAIKDFRQAARRKDESLAMAFHELRSPLTAIIGGTYVLRSDRVEEHGRAVDIIDRNAKAQEQLIEDLLRLSQVDAGRADLQPCLVDVGAIILQVIEDIAPAASTAGVSIQLHADAPVMVRGDARHLWQIFWNLVSNSLRFAAPKGQIHISVCKEAKFAKICVSDNGCGISKDQLPYIFDRFQQGHIPQTGEFHGFGLGLAIVKEFLQMHGGTVTAESPGLHKGATFTIRLPLAS